MCMFVICLGVIYQCVITVSVSSRSVVGDENVVGQVSVRHLEFFVIA